MKVSEILYEGPIYNTPEYDLSSKEDQYAAFVAQLPSKEAKELMAEFKIELPTHVKVTLSDGSDYNVKVEHAERSFMLLQPAATSYKKKINKSGRDYYIIDGPVSIRTNTKFFTGYDFTNSDDYKKFSKKYYDMMTKRREEFDKKLQIDLREKLPPAAKKALADDLLGKIKDGHSEVVRKWFVDNGFKMTNGSELPPASEFKKMNSLKGWVISTKSYGGPNRGNDGISIDIDWNKRTFGHIGWSSAD